MVPPMGRSDDHRAALRGLPADAWDGRWRSCGRGRPARPAARPAGSAAGYWSSSTLVKMSVSPTPFWPKLLLRPSVQTG